MKTLLAGAITASLLAAVVVTVPSLMQTPTYEASATVLVGQERSAGWDPDPAGGSEEVNTEGLPRIRIDIPDPRLQDFPNTLALAIDTTALAEGTIRRLGLEMSPGELLSNLTTEPVEDTQFVRLSYTDTDPGRARRVVNAVGREASEYVSAAAGADGMTATLFEEASLPEAPASPKPFRNGLFALVAGLVLCAGLAKLALPGVGARVAGTLGERPSRLAKLVGQAGVLGRRHSAPSIVERVKEKKLLRALGRRGKLTAVEAAVETSLTVEEANRMLFELASRGHLEVTVEHGKLPYSFWGEHGA